jgi:hypothetical protein
MIKFFRRFQRSKEVISAPLGKKVICDRRIPRDSKCSMNRCVTVETRQELRKKSFSRFKGSLRILDYVNPS